LKNFHDSQSLIFFVGRQKTRKTNKSIRIKKFKIIPVKMGHLHTRVGGLHCTILDTVRDSKLESYFG